MEQCSQIDVLRQAPFTDAVSTSQIRFVPTGIHWFHPDLFSQLIAEAGLTVIIYPEETWLLHHLSDIQKAQPQCMVRYISSDLPPHAVRDTWETLQHYDDGALLIPARLFYREETLKTLSAMVSVKRIVIESAHLFLPEFQGKRFSKICNNLSLLQAHWTNHPPLLLLSSPLAMEETRLLQHMFHLQDDVFIRAFPTSLSNIQFQIKRCFTQFQKFRHIKQQLHPQKRIVNLIGCPNSFWVKDLSRRLSWFNHFSLHRQMDIETIRDVIEGFVEYSGRPLIVEASLFHLLPFQRFEPESKIQVFLWEIPTSQADLISKSVLPVSSIVTIQLFLTKEDFWATKTALKTRLKGSPYERSALKRLARLRQLMNQTQQCYTRALIQGILPEQASLACGQCEGCLQQTNYSLWRNLIRQVLF